MQLVGMFDSKNSQVKFTHKSPPSAMSMLPETYNLKKKKITENINNNNKKNSNNDNGQLYTNQKRKLLPLINKKDSLYHVCIAIVV